jgi:four helix bundle protein
MPVFRSFRELDAYKVSLTAAHRIFHRTKKFPREEVFSLTSQIRRSSRAVSSMLAEAWARRRYPAAFISKLTEALGEAMETQNWLDHAVACEYITEREFDSFDQEWQRVGAMVNGMIGKANTFCKPTA